MARVVVIGGGIGGLSSAMLLAGDGHEVTVLERDPAPTPADADAAWADWERRGVNQFRMIHYFLPRFRALLEAELPQVASALDGLGALRSNPMADAPAELTGGWRDRDERFEALTARRPVAETAVARSAEKTPGVTVRRGVTVTGLLTGASGRPGVPHVTGVRTESGEELTADLVVDASGRRSPLPSWLAAIGARPPTEELEDSGFVYYGRHFTSGDGSLPPAMGPLLQHYGTLSVLTLPADNGTWGLGIITSAKDASLRSLRDPERWEALWRSYPLVAHWLDGEPISDGVAIMAKIEDRHRQYCIDGGPVATGVLAVADSWACTNPSVGRGASIGLLHALALRDVVRAGALDAPVELALAFDAATLETVEPWYRATLSYDRHRLGEIEALVAGEAYEPADPNWDITRALQFGAMQDPDLLRAFLSVASLVALPDAAVAAPGVFDKVLAVGSAWRDEAIPGPDRAGVLAAVGS